MSEEQTLLTDNAPDHKFFTMVPNYLIDLPLSPIAFRVYVYIKRRTGEALGGKCWEASENIARACAISTGALSKAKTELQTTKLIEIKKVPGKQGEYPHDEIAILDMWQYNDLYCRADKSERQERIKEWRKALTTWRVAKGWRVADEERIPRKEGHRRKNHPL
jgi:hypothetical protein